MKYILFDLDGTLLDSELGIVRCFNHALRQFGQAERTIDQLAECIGPPLEHSFGNLLSTQDETVIRQAVEAYRSRYRETGLWESELYEGIVELLSCLHTGGGRLLIVTTKPEPFASQLAEYHKMDDYFESVNGTTFDKSRLDKFDVMRYVVERDSIQPGEAVMVGDRKHDILAAKEHGLATIGVLWGFGERAELIGCESDHIVESVAELGDILGRL